jgi:signal transduction histidine kinase
MQRLLSNYSISKQFTVLVMGLGLIISLSSLLYSLITMAYHEKERFIAETAMETKLIADFATSPLAFLDTAGAMENLAILSSHKSIEQVVLFDSNGKFFAQYNPHHLSQPKLAQFQSGFVNNQWFSRSATYRLYLPIVYKGDNLGYLYLQKNGADIFIYSEKALLTLTIFSFLLMGIVLMIVIQMSHIILQPILSLVEKTQFVARERDYELRVDYEGSNEIAKLYNALNLLLEETQDLTEGLEQRVSQRTKELQDSLENLTLAQGQLIESEKMAALGNLVSGVAHEVNTPLGNALTGGSIILRESKLIQDLLDEGSLKRSVMDEKLGIIIQSAALMIKSLTHAADLVKNFKRISVDQSIDDLRDFDLRLYLDTVIQTYHNKLKHQKVNIEIISDTIVPIYSYPGSFAQIFNNFINNALLHAFEGMEEGAKITIELQHREEYLMVRFTDNGIGVNEKILPNIFEPFVTSKRNAGGTGLGMNIIYNIVTQKLKGTIHVASQIGKGTTFKLRLPYLEKTDNGEVI